MTKNTILIVEDNDAIRQFITHRISSELSMDTLEASTMSDANDIIAQQRDNIFLAVLDLNLPDATNGEIVDSVLAEGIPVIVLTGSIKESTQNMMVSKPIIDYVVKKNMSEMSYLVTLIDRVRGNPSTKILIVDDNDSTREYLRLILSIQHFDIYTANDGKHGLEILKENPDIKLIITDYVMPNMNGEEFILNVRESFSREQISIIAISSETDSKLSAKLLKSGANDFITRPFLREEFFCRVGNNIDAIRNFEYIKNTAIRDHLTGMYNRKYLFEAGTNIYENARRKNLTIAVAMIDIDYFKKINDTWGHNIGDKALKHISDILAEHVRSSDVLARFGGEEFCVVATNIDAPIADVVFNRIRNKIENNPLVIDDIVINITVSIGVALDLHDDFESMITAADKNLYSAKETGRNRVIIS